MRKIAMPFLESLEFFPRSSNVVLVPIQVLLEFRSSGSVGDHSPAPHMSAFLSCMLWILYGLLFVQPNSIYVIVANGGGCLIPLFYLVTFAIFLKSWTDKRRRIAGILGTTTFTVAPVAKLRYHIIGAIAMICQIGTYIAPLSTLIMAISAKKLELIDGTLAGFNLINYIMWFLYATVPFDLYLLVPNVLGAIVTIPLIGSYKNYQAYMMKVRGIPPEPPLF